MLWGFYFILLEKKMQLPNEFAYSLKIYKAGAIDETVGFNEWETVRTVFSRADVDYEEWTNSLAQMSYTPEATLDASDNGTTLEIASKQIKQG